MAAPDVERAAASEGAGGAGRRVLLPAALPGLLRGLMLSISSEATVTDRIPTQRPRQFLAWPHAHPPTRALAASAHYALGGTSCSCGAGPRAAARTPPWTQALALYDPQAHRALAAALQARDLGMWALTALWSTGRCGSWAVLTRPSQHSQAACTLAQEVAHPYSLVLGALVRGHGASVPTREALAVHAQAAAAMTLATEQGFPFAERVAWATVLHGWALAMQGQGEAGLAAMRQGLSRRPGHRGPSREQTRTSWACWRSVNGGRGRPTEEFHALAEALGRAGHQTELRYYAAELSRLKEGGLAAAAGGTPDAAQAEACFQGAYRRRPSGRGGGSPRSARHREPGAPLAAARQAGRSPRAAGADLWLVHRGL